MRLIRNTRKEAWCLTQNCPRRPWTVLGSGEGPGIDLELSVAVAAAATDIEDVLSRRGLRLPPQCARWGAVVGGRTQSSGGKDVPDPTSDASVHARRPRSREGPRGAVCRSQARAASDARPPGRRWPAGWRTEPRACCRAGSCEVCDARGTCDGAVGDCVRCTSPRGNVQLLGPQLREGRAQDVSAGWHD